MVDQLNADPAARCYLVQLPLPPGLQPNPLRRPGSTRPRTPTGCTHETPRLWLALGRPAPLPCTPRGAVCVELLRRGRRADRRGARSGHRGRPGTSPPGGPALPLLLTRKVRERDRDRLAPDPRTGMLGVLREVVHRAGGRRRLGPGWLRQKKARGDVRLRGAAAPRGHPPAPTPGGRRRGPGSPRPGVAGFLAPVPGGIGPNETRPGHAADATWSRPPKRALTAGPRAAMHPTS